MIEVADDLTRFARLLKRFLLGRGDAFLGQGFSFLGMMTVMGVDGC